MSCKPSVGGLAAAVSALVTLVAGTATAQSVTGSIQGTVVDQSGGVFAGGGRRRPGIDRAVPGRG
jgi:hypothetical protein